jgi:hypothetical protein
MLHRVHAGVLRPQPNSAAACAKRCQQFPQPDAARSSPEDGARPRARPQSRGSRLNFPKGELCSVGSTAALIVRATDRSEGQTRTSRVEVGQSAQGAQSGCKEIFTAACDNKLRQLSQAAADRLCRDREFTGLASLPGYWVAFALGAEEAAVIRPLARECCTLLRPTGKLHARTVRDRCASD